jgi:RHH-type proline utilization regulon transcriptional repressor/proline dehydrogenase/delta 1-pyrroline-5-carboxylate dehydrogenase
MSSNGQVNLESCFITLTSKQHEGWTIYFYEEYSTIFLSTGNLSDEVIGLIQKYAPSTKRDFRAQSVLGSTPFLMGVFVSKKEIRFYTPKLSSELFLLQQSDILNSGSNKVSELRAHTELAAALSFKNFPSEIESLINTTDLPNLLSDTEYTLVENKANEIIKKLLVQINNYQPSMFEDLTDFGLGLTAQYSLLRIHLLKFLAILPSLDHDIKGKEVKRILLESLYRFLKDNRLAFRAKKKGQDRAFPRSYTFVVKICYYISKILPAKLLTALVRASVRLMAKRFIAGESIETADKSLKELSQTGRDVTLDQLGELVVSEKEADNYCDHVLKLVHGFSLHVGKGELNGAGIQRAHVSIKVSALCSDFKPHAFLYTYNLIAPRLKKILLAAKEEDVFINIDAEHYHYRDNVFEIYKKLLLETPELQDFSGTGIVVQAYLRDAYEHLNAIIDLARLRGLNMPVRLVKGAYWDAETVEGDAYNFNAPQFLNKEETDIHFRQLIIQIFKGHPHIKLCLASHNFSDHAYARALKEINFPDIGEFEHQCLHMTYEALSTALAKMKWPTRNYVPVGSLLVGMAYLVRRIMENSSQVGVLTIMRSHKKHVTLSAPTEIHKNNLKDGKLVRDVSVSKLEDEFFNVTPVRLYLKTDLLWMKKKISDFTSIDCGKSYENKFIITGDMINIFSSSDPLLLVGKIRFANLEDTEIALATTDKTYHAGTWANLNWSFRTAILTRAANLMLAKRCELAALIVYEAGKSINEALADVDEAIDFINFYARTEAFLNRSETRLSSRGPVAVIAPWNFPLAIPCGMVVSALVAGNTVILKSAEQTPLIAQVLVDLLHSAGIPADVLIHLPGAGETVGDKLVRDQRISTIIFTGSKAVGMLIASLARTRIFYNRLTNKKYLVKAITEMGGKNAVIVTQNAELDETISGILYSAFGHAGQKCSALSRVIVHHSLKHKLIERLTDACRDLKVGASFNFETTVNPIIGLDDVERLHTQINEARIEATQFGGDVIINRGHEEGLPGYCVGPVVIELPYERAFAPDSFAQKELFGPVLHVVGFDNLDNAIKLFNSTNYALTGGVFSQSQNDIDYLLSKIECGNIYINRSVTGARVAIEPFGGFKLSGTGPKAGGRHYLQHLHIQLDDIIPEVARSIDEGPLFYFDLAKPSFLSNASRLERMENFLDQFIWSFETIYQGISGAHKDFLRDYRKWMSKNFIDFVERQHKNRQIPGQISYNDFRMKTENAVAVMTNPKPSMKTLIQVFAGVLVGTGMTILCRNRDAFIWWMTIRDQFIKAGFSKENIDVYLVNAEDLARALNEQKLSVIIYDGNLTDYALHVGNFLNDGMNDLRMRQILTVSDHLRANDFYHQHMNYVWVRSMAINTMRHGAPLDLNL